MSDGPVTLDELKTLLTSMEVTTVVVEAIDDPALQRLRGWDLRGWSYVLIRVGRPVQASRFAEEIDVRIEVFAGHRGNSVRREA